MIRQTSDPAGSAGGRDGVAVALSGLTTLRLGGPARRIVAAGDDAEIIAAIAAADAAAEPVLVLGGGSNLVVADAGFDGTVIRIASRGVAVGGATGGLVALRVAAGEPWDAVVSAAVADGLSGIECLSGIPGASGATPIQNVGAYGQQVSETIASVRVYDRVAREVRELSAADCRFGYRHSRLRGANRRVVLAVTFTLARCAHAAPVRYPELARTLGVATGAAPPLGEVRDAVLALRAGKGMVLDAADPDSVSAGSFFVNPILAPERFAELADRAQGRPGTGAGPPAWPEPDGRVKTSAAWLIERAGFHRGYGQGRVGISSKHTLALINRGGATTAELLALAREIRDGVRAAFGVTLVPEPVLVGVSL